MSTQQQTIDFDQVADVIVVLSVDGREIAVPRRDVVAVPRSPRKYLRPESLLEVAPVCATPPPLHVLNRADPRREKQR